MDYIGLTLEDLDRRGGTRLANAIQAVVRPDHRAAVAASLGHSVATGAPFRLKYQMRRANGDYRCIDGRADPLRDGDRHIVQWYGVCIDVDDETRMQEALRAAQDKLARAAQAASLAELSASIAHEVNQPLAAIVTNSDACQRWLSAAPPNLPRARVTLERIIRNANSAAEVVSGIRALFRQTGQARASADINEVIAEVCQLMAGETAKKNIRIETDLQSDLPQILIDRVQMQQVVVNLVRNGIDAMALIAGDPRSLRIRSCRLELPDISGLELQKQISEENHPPIVFITGHGDIPSSVRAIKGGAIDFLTKPFREKELIEAIRAAIAEDRQARDERAELVTLRRRLRDLTPREREVLPLVVSGPLNKQAAAELGISEITLQIHRSKVMHKMAAASLADLVRIAEKLRIPVTHSRRAGSSWNG